MPTLRLDELELDLTVDEEAGEVSLMGKWKIKKPPVPPPPPPPPPPPSIQLEFTNVVFQAEQAGTPPANKSCGITNKGTGTLSGLSLGTTSYGAGASGWLTPTLVGTTAPTSITLAVNQGSIAVGSYTATVPVLSGVADNSPQNLTVTLQVVSPPPPPPPPPPPGGDNWTPELPVGFDTAINMADYPNGTTGPIGSGLQAAINAAPRGHIIRLANGSVHDGNFTLPNKTLNGTQGVLICSEAYYQKLIGNSSPGARGVGYRVDPVADAPYLATMRTTNTVEVLKLATNANVNASYYRFEGIKFTAVKNQSVSTHQGMINVEYPSDLAGGVSAMDTDIQYGPIFSHCVVDADGIYYHPSYPTVPSGSKYGIRLGGRNCAVLDSYIDIGNGNSGQESHCIDGYRGPGPFMLDNNYLRGAGINVICGGAVSVSMENTQGLSQIFDWTTQRSYYTKEGLVKSTGVGVVLKNWDESKNSGRRLCRGNVMYEMWGGQGQAGFPILFQNTIPTATPNGQELYQVVNDTSIVYNKFLKGSSGPNNGASINNFGGPPPPPMTRTRYQHNIWWGICAKTALAGGAEGQQAVSQFQYIGPHQYISFEHNTFVQHRTWDYDAGVPRYIKNYVSIDRGASETRYPVGTRYRANIVYYGQYGFSGSGAVDSEYAAKTKFDPTCDYSQNLVCLNLGTDTSKTQPTQGSARYDLTTNKYLLNDGAVGFIDIVNGNFRLQAGSPGERYSPSGINCGADQDLVDAWTLHSIDGQWGTPPPDPGGTGTDPLALDVEQLPAGVVSGIAFGTQPVVIGGAEGTQVTAELVNPLAGSGALVNATAIFDASQRAYFDRLRIDGGVGVVHTLTFTSPGYDPPAVQPQVTPVAATTGSTVQVSEATTYQLWEGATPASGNIAWEIDPAVYSADRDAVMTKWAQNIGPTLLLLSWRPGVQANTNYVVADAPINGWPDPTAWTTLRTHMRSGWVSGAPIHLDWFRRELDEIAVPMRAAYAAAGKPMPRIQLIMQTHDSEPTAFRATASNYANIVLAVFNMMQTEYGFLPDDVTIINEPNNIGQWTNTEVANALKATKDLLNANGFFPRFSQPCNSTEAPIPQYDAIKAITGPGYAGALSYHRYGGRTLANRQAIAAKAVAEGIPALMTEWIVSTGSVQQSIEETVLEANSAAWMTLAGFYPGTAASGSFIYMPGDGSPQLTTGAGRLHAAYFGRLEPFAPRLAATESSANLASVMAWANSKGKFVVVVRATAAIGSLTVGGLPPGTYNVYRTTLTGTDVMDLLGSVVAGSGGQATLTGATAISGAGIFTIVRQ